MFLNDYSADAVENNTFFLNNYPAPVMNSIGFLNNSSTLGSNELYGISSIIEVEKKYIAFVNNSSVDAVEITLLQQRIILAFLIILLRVVAMNYTVFLLHLRQRRIILHRGSK